MTVTTHNYDSATIGATVNAADAADLNTVTGSPEYTHGLSGAVAVRFPDATADYLRYDGPTTDYSGCLVFRVDAAPASGALRVVTLRDNLNGDLSQFRVDSDGTFKITNISTANGVSMGSWTLGEVYLLQWQLNDTAETVTWRITSMVAGSSYTEGVADFSAWAGANPARLYVGGPGTSSACEFVADTLIHDDNASLSWLATSALRTGLFRYDATTKDEIPVAIS